MLNHPGTGTCFNEYGIVRESDILSVHRNGFQVVIFVAIPIGVAFLWKSCIGRYWLETTMSKCSRLFMAIIVVAAFAVDTGLAHETLIKIANPNPKKGETIVAEITNSHVIIDASEEVTDPELAAVSIIQDGISTPATVTADPVALVSRIEAVFPGEGTAWLALHRKPQLYSQTPEGLKEGDSDSIKGTKVLFTNKYEKFAKVLLNAAASDQSFAQPIGHLLEIVPETNPADLRVGDELKIRILYDGKPVFAPVTASYDGFTKRENSYAFYASPEGPDAIFVKVHQPGFWVIMVNYKTSGGKGIRTHSLNAALEFEVK